MSADLVGSLNKRLSHHRVARGHRHNAQTQRYCPCESTHTPRRVVTTDHSARRCWEERNYGTVSSERVEPLNQRLFPHRMIPCDHPDAQMPALRPIPTRPKSRTCFKRAPRGPRLGGFRGQAVTRCQAVSGSRNSVDVLKMMQDPLWDLWLGR